MTFSAPVWLAVAVGLLAVGAAGLRAAEARRRRDLDRFVSGPLRRVLTVSSSPRGRLTRSGLLLAGLALGCVALARPILGWDWQETHHRGTDVLFAVDVSRSMLADDVKPDRLTRAKLAVLDLLQKLGGDRVGLVAFAGTAFLQSPLTTDHAAFQQSVEALDTSVIPRGGTDVGAALHEAEEAFRTAGKGPRLLVLLSDGEDLAGNARTAAAEAAKQGITVYTVGVGTPAGERISLSRAGGRGLVMDEHGRPVVSKLDEAGLRAVAEATGGFYVPLGSHGEGLDAIYQRVLSDAPKHDLATRSQRVPIERFQWPLGLALALVVVEALAGEARRRAPASGSRRLQAAVVAPALLVLLVAGRASAGTGDAEKAYAAGDYESALDQYRAAADAAPDDARLRLNEGVAAYRAGKHDEAAQAFSKALDTRDVELQQRAYYDLGNARFRLGEAAATKAPDQARTSLEESVKAYDGALALDPQDGDAKFNRDVAKARLEALKRQQQQQQQGQQQQQQQGQPQQQRASQGQQSQEPQSHQGQPQQQAAASPSGSGSQEAQPKDGQGSSPQEKTGAAEKKSDAGSAQEHPAAQSAEKPGSDGAKADARPQGTSGPEATPPRAEPATPDASPSATGSPEERAGEASPPSRPDTANATPQEAGAAPGPRRDAPQTAGDEKRNGTPERADGKRSGAAPEARARRPGEMTADEAARLLDSLRSDEIQAPRATARRGAAGSDDDEPIRNW